MLATDETVLSREISLVTSNVSVSVLPDFAAKAETLPSFILPKALNAKTRLPSSPLLMVPLSVPRRSFIVKVKSSATVSTMASNPVVL